MYQKLNGHLAIIRCLWISTDLPATQAAFEMIRVRAHTHCSHEVLDTQDHVRLSCPVDHGTEPCRLSCAALPSEPGTRMCASALEV